MNQTSYASIDDYIMQQSKEAQEILFKIKEIIYEVVPQAQELFNYGTCAFSLVKDGKRDQQIMMAAFKRHVGFYPHPTTIEHFHSDLSSYKKGKGSIQFQFKEPLPEKLIKEMIAYRYQEILKSWKDQ